MVAEKSFIYFPTKYPEGDWHVGEHNLNGLRCIIKDHFIESEDGTKIHAWLYQHFNSREILLYCHGNAGSIATRKEKMALMLNSGIDIFTLDYRGYGRSEGSPTEKGLIEDVEAAYQYLLNLGYDSSNIIVYGASLGGGAAIELACKYKTKAIILESIFTSIPDMARVRMPFVPKFIVRTKFDNFKKISSLKCPVFLIHGDQDEVIPVNMGRQLFEQAVEPKIYYEIKGAGHNNIYDIKPDILKHEFRAFLTQ